MTEPENLDALASEVTALDRPALNKQEYAFVQAMNIVCAIIARWPREQVIQKVMTEFGCQEPKARLLIAKADDFLASGVYSQAGKARELYAARLQRIHDLCMGRAEEDQIEILVKPTRVIDEGGKFRMVNGQHVKTRPNVLNTAALQIALAAAEKAAKIAGIKVDSDRGTTVNVQINNLPGAAVTSQLANADLCQLAGLQFAGEFIPEDVREEPDAVDES